MAWSAAGLQLTNDTSGILPVAFAQGHNNIIMSLRGNQVISGVPLLQMGQVILLTLLRMILMWLVVQQ